MTAEQLQSVFQVDAAHLVPHYELVTLHHHGSTHHRHHTSKRDTSTYQQVAAAAAASPNSDHRQHHKKIDFSKSAYYSEVKHTGSDVGRQIDLNALSEHNVSLSAFGEVYNLTLRPTQGLFKDGIQALRMWTVKSEPNATNGLNYQPVVEVSQLHASHDQRTGFQIRQWCNNRYEINGARLIGCLCVDGL